MRSWALLLVLLTACGGGSGLCIYQNDPDIGDSCWPDSPKETCSGDYVHSGTCAEQGFSYDCSGFGVFFTTDENACTAGFGSDTGDTGT
jgi:hypothetical protein